MDLRAYWATIIVHAGGLTAAVLADFSLESNNCCGMDPVGGDGGGGGGSVRNVAISDLGNVPLIFIASSQEPQQLVTTFKLEASNMDPAERACPESATIDQDARFEGSGPSLQQLHWLQEPGENPAVCALVGREGRVARAYLARTSGDRADDDALLRYALRLRFRAARRDGRRVEVWHRLIFNRPLGVRHETPQRPGLLLSEPFSYTL